MEQEYRGICPLLAIGTIRVDDKPFCMGERCAWWDGEQCAVVGISRATFEAGDIIQAVIDAPGATRKVQG
ncbi:hypothetical protein [Anaerotruncus rubiinfantis]|jgi:hypothetical protein|uniref:hypothetical protein n=1 Tax=Anaerotruncus rubiinfantis TaxID=1720200 RepID=UPI003D7930B6